MTGDARGAGALAGERMSQGGALRAGVEEQLSARVPAAAGMDGEVLQLGTCLFGG